VGADDEEAEEGEREEALAGGFVARKRTS